MAVPKVFISSTCYDLAVVRTELRSFIEGYGFEPVMSEYSDILYDYRVHTHTSCLQEIPYCDMVILIIGGRYGGKAAPKALDLIDIESLKQKSLSKECLKENENLSITQLEFLKSIETGIPVFPFVSTGVMNDHSTWERNKENGIVDKIIFPNIEKQETAKYIFEFINYMRLQHEGNSIITFSKLDDIKNHLRKQWAALFQRLLVEQRSKIEEDKQINYLSEQIAGLKTAIVTSFSNNTELGDTARGAIKYRRLISFLSLIYQGSDNFVDILKTDVEWDKILEISNIVAIANVSNQDRRIPPRSILILKDCTYFEVRFNYRMFEEFKRKWNEFRSMKDSLKSAIINAITDDIDERMSFSVVRHFDENYLEKFSLGSLEEGSDSLKIFWQSETFDADQSVSKLYII